MLKRMQLIKNISAAQKPEESIGTATEDFTILETSSFIADAMRNATGAEIALIPHCVYYKGNFAKFYEGDVTMLYRFYLRGLGAEDYLTTYEITGENLKALMEHPIINGEELNAHVCVFRPRRWNTPPGEIKDEKRHKADVGGRQARLKIRKRYTVAAWPTSIDESYIASALSCPQRAWQKH